MQEELARPVIEVVEFPSGRVTHEMFAFGSEIAVVPVQGDGLGGDSPMATLAKEQLAHRIRQWVGVACAVRFTSQSSAEIFVPKGMVSTLIGKGGDNIRSLQEELGGIRLKVSPYSEMPEGLEVVGDNNSDMQDHRARESNAWDYSKRGRKGGKSHRR